jgi:predicted TIM-barrel fold metal-dependent hydrolase
MALDDERDDVRAGAQRKIGQLGVQEHSRREFLTALAACGLSAVAARGSSVTQGAAKNETPRLIDVHHHVFPPDFVKVALDTYIPQNRPIVSGWTPEKSLAEMDANGVAAAIISLTSPGTWVGESLASRSLTRKCNEYCAQLVRDYPGRFGFFASLPLPDTEGSLREISYALDVLKADGIGLMTNYDDKWPGDPAFAPVFEELKRRKAIVRFHPTAASCCKNLVPGVPRAWAEFPQETTRAVLSLLVSGSFVRLREIRFMFSHAGGTIPMIAGRISSVTHFVDDFGQKAPSGIEYEFKKLHYDIAGSADRSAMAALMNLVPTSQILFGSDYPFIPIAATAVGMTTLGLPLSDLQAIGRANAMALFPRWRT